MADFVIKPQQHRTKGAVPKKALAGVVILFAVVLVGMYVVSNDVEAPGEADAQAVATISSPENVLAQTAGSPQTVQEAEENQRRDAEAARRAALNPPANTASNPAMQAPAVNVPLGAGGLPPYGVATGGQPVGTLQGNVGSDNAADPNQIRAAQELTRRTTDSLVFDETRLEGGGKGASPAAAANDAVQAGLRQVAQGGGESDSMSQALNWAEKMMTTQGAASAPSQGNPQEAWAQRVSEASASRRAQALYPTPAVAPLMLAQGTLIPAVTTRPLNTDVPGAITAQVSMDVYDSQTASKLLIPKGAVLYGAYNNSVGFGQTRAQFAFTRLRMPDNSTYELPGATAYDQMGQAGVEASVDRHFLTTFGSALLIGVLADRVTKTSAVPQTSAYGTGGVSATGQVFVDIAKTELERYKSTPATQKLPAATRINVEVAADMVFPSVYRGPRF